MARRLKTIARWVNENLGPYGYYATVKPSEYNYSVGSYFGGNVVGYHGSRDGTLFECWKLTDLRNWDDVTTTIGNNRYRRKNLRQFAGRDGIWRRIKSHNSAETYRHNAEVERFVRGLVRTVREENPDAEVANYEAEEFGAEELGTEGLKGANIEMAKLMHNRFVPAWKSSYGLSEEAEIRNRRINNILHELINNGNISSERMFYTMLTFMPTRQVDNLLEMLERGIEDNNINYGVSDFDAEEFGAERYEPTPKEIRFLVRNLRAVWIKYERGIYDEDDVIQKMERILYHTGVMQEGYAAEEFGAETETFEARYKNDGTIAYTETEWFGGYSRRGINSWGAIPLGNFEGERYYFIDGKIVMTSPQVKTLKNEYNVKAIRDLRHDGWDRHYQSMATPIQKLRARKLIMKVFREYDRNTGFSRGAEEFGADVVGERDVDFQVYAYINDDEDEWGEPIGLPMPEKSYLSGSDEFHYIGFDSIEKCKEYITNLPKGWSGNIEVIIYDEESNPEIISYEEYKIMDFDAESFKSETQATVISSLVSLGALGVGILLGKKLFFDEKVLG
tara:strand:+ start:9302 stop:10987 length:1686 start_codon:yes stop_codon:yes gene_type:complete